MKCARVKIRENIHCEKSGRKSRSEGGWGPEGLADPPSSFLPVPPPSSLLPHPSSPLEASRAVQGI